MKPLVLASSSINRQSLLERLRLPFECLSPDIDESPLPNEALDALSIRLSLEKARKIAAMRPDAVVIGSDQVGAHQNHLISKPHTHEAAIKQWHHLSGETIHFYTGVAVIADGKEWVEMVPTEVKFKSVNQQEIESYLLKDTPYACCAGFKIESLGVVMTEWVKSDDPTALIGLPLIQTTKLLMAAGINPLA